MTNYNAPYAGDPLPSGPVRGSTGPAFSAVSILAVISGLLALTNAIGFGLIFAILAIVLGAVGMLAAVLPGTRGGILSFLAVGAGLLGIIIGVIRLIGHLAA
jgi:hypothetical protein